MTEKLLDLNNTPNAEVLVKKFTNKILEGTIDSVKAGVILKIMAKVSEEVLANPEVKATISVATVNAITGLAKGERLYGAKISYRATSTRYDYSDCGHTEYNSLVAIEQIIKERKKAIEDKLKLVLKDSEASYSNSKSLGISTFTEDIIIADLPKLTFEPNGEIVSVKAPIKYQSKGCVYSFK